eukprot:2736790-Rhodomonas_salina.1
MRTRGLKFTEPISEPCTVMLDESVLATLPGTDLLSWAPSCEKMRVAEPASLTRVTNTRALLAIPPAWRHLTD